MAQQMDLTEQFKPVLLWLSAHFNPQRFFIFLSVVLYLVAWNRGIALLYGIVSLLLAILAVSYLLPALNIRNVKLSFKTIEHTTVRPGFVQTLGPFLLGFSLVMFCRRSRFGEYRSTL